MLRLPAIPFRRVALTSLLLSIAGVCASPAGAAGEFTISPIEAPPGTRRMAAPAR